MEAKVGYEIFPDRFRRIGPPRVGLKRWEDPVGAHTRHEYDFYGGNLKGIIAELDYMKELGADFIYLTPIFKATTNHRYDTTDYFSLDPLLGSEADLMKLSSELHRRQMRLVLDIAINHVGKKNPWFEKALKGGKEASYFCEKNGDFLRWYDVDNLPELNLENRELRELLWEGNDSVLTRWTELGVDDWRLDCAYDIGYHYCKDITSQLKTKGDHNTIGEIWSYPKKWFSSGVMDGVMNYFFRDLITSLLLGEVKGGHIATILEDTVKDCPLESLLKSWNVLSSHDTARISNTFGDLWKLAVALQFTLPGSPLIYYGEELGMEGETDPYCRQPMDWQLANEENSTYTFYQKMINLFKSSPALRTGNLEYVYTENRSILAFVRSNGRIRDFKLVIINPSSLDQSFQLYIRESSLMNCTHLIDHFTGSKIWSTSARLNGIIKAKSFGIFYPETERVGYSSYKRID